MKHKLFALVLAFCVAMGAVALAVPGLTAREAVQAAGTRTEVGLKVADATETYSAAKAFTAMPKTYEAIIHLPKTYSSRGGIILGNYGPTNTTAAYSFEIHQNGYPKLYYDVDNVGAVNPNVVNINFTSVDVRSDSYVHLAIVHDTAAHKAYCYLNGTLAQTVDVDNGAHVQQYYNGFDFVPSTPARVGGDWRDGNAQYFKGAIKAIECYTDLRSATEIAADYARMSTLAHADLTDSALLCAYDLTQQTAYLSDLTSNKYDLVASSVDWEAIGGLSFEAEDKYEVKNALAARPHTWEAEVFVPERTARAGVIFGNWGLGKGSSINFEIYSNGHPRLLFTSMSGTTKNDYNKVFESVDVRGKWTHVAIVLDESAGTLTLYVDGEQAETVSNVPGYYEDVNLSDLFLGRDPRADGSSRFLGAIRSLALYSDVRTAAEVAEDAKSAADVTDGALLLSYELSMDDKGTDIPDRSAHANTAEWKGPKEVVLDGLTFEAENFYKLERTLTAVPHTVAAELYLDASVTDRGGVILGNYGVSECFNFEINTAGKPRIYYTKADGTGDQSTVFSGDVRTGDWAKVVFVYDDANGTASVWIDGKQVGTASAMACAPELLGTKFLVGGDNRSGNAQYFKGQLRSVAAWSGVLTDDEIVAWTEGALNTASDKLLVSYTLSAAGAEHDFADLSANANDLHYETTWFADKEPVTDYAYSFAVVGDTQIICERDPSQMDVLYDWILANRQSKNIQYVFGLGDITNSNTQAEWNVARAAVSQMDGVIPYSLVRGNHDGTPEMKTPLATARTRTSLAASTARPTSTPRGARSGSAARTT